MKLVIVSTNTKQSYKDLILQFLDDFDWKPESMTDNEGQYTLILLAHLDIKEIKIHVKFSEDSHWIYFSAIFLPSIKRNHTKIYSKILEINYSTTLTKFGMSPQGNIYALIELPLKTIDYNEFTSALRRLTNDINKFLIPIASLLQEEEVL